MKKLLLILVASFLGTHAFSSTRLILFEEFTSENCPPCATYNPAFNELLNANPTKVVAIKYQNDIPSPGPMYYHNTTDVEARQTYYSNTSSPNAKGDGTGITIPSSGHPAYVTQTLINNRYAISSPFTIDVSHYLSSDGDSIYAHATITCTAATTATMVAQMAIIERNIYFTSAPGSNGEKIFEGVMKKMLPSASGTAMTSAQTVGMITNLDYGWQLANVYDTNQLAVVVFVQNNTTREVYQSGFSRTHINNDAGVTDVTGIPSITCTGQVTPTATIYNYGMSTLTSCSLTVQIDAGPISYYPWSGSVAMYGSTQVNLPMITVPAGNHTLRVGTTNPNASTDLDVNNDRMNMPVSVFGAPVSTPLLQQFSLSTFPPAGWVIENVSGSYTWARVTAGLPSYSAKMNFFYETSGTDNLYTSIINFTNANSNAALDFDYSYAQYTTENDQLIIEVSTDCGQSWDAPIFDSAGTTLATHIPVGNNVQYTPASSADWEHVSLSLGAYAGSPGILIRFQAVSDWGNNLFIDNINVTDGNTSIDALTGSTLKGINVYPNLIVMRENKKYTKINYELEKAQNLSVTVSDIFGSVVQSFDLNNVKSGVALVDLYNVSAGTYFLTIRSGESVITKKLYIVE
jgi:hypothetical protein